MNEEPTQRSQEQGLWRVDGTDHNVSFIEVFEISSIELDEYLDKFSLIRSYITTVSFIEYPTIVSTAATIERLTSNDNNENIPKVINTS